MSSGWTVKTSNGDLLQDFVCSSRQEVGRKLVSGRYDAFRLEVSASYREMFDRAVSKVLEREGWKIVRARVSR
jgi:hypothetical protein